MHMSASRSRSASHLLNYGENLTSEMVTTGSESTCGNYSYPCEECRHVAAYSGHSLPSLESTPDLGVSTINCTHQTIGNRSGYTGPLTSTVVNSPQFTGTPECLRHCELNMKETQPAWSPEEFGLLQRYEPSGCDITTKIHRTKQKFCSNNNCSMPSATPCSFTRSVSSSVLKTPFHSNDSSLPRCKVYPPCEVLGPRPECDGQEFSPAKMARRTQHISSRQKLPSTRNTAKSQATMNNSWRSGPVSSSHSGLECTAVSRAEGSTFTDLNDLSDVTSVVGKRMCCISVSNGKRKSFNQKSIGHRLKQFSKNCGQAGKSSKSSLQTLTVL